jgi:hypothetical protein
VCDQQPGATAPRRSRDAAGAGERVGDRLLQQHRVACLEQPASRLDVLPVGQADDEAVDVASPDQRLDRAVQGDAVRLRDRRGLRVAVDDRHEFRHVAARDCLGVEAPHEAGANDCKASDNIGTVFHFRPGDETRRPAERQRP